MLIVVPRLCKREMLGWRAFRCIIQAPSTQIGLYIIDSFGAKAKLVFEYDNERTKWLGEQKHYRVIRFWNKQILQNVERRISQIADSIHADVKLVKELK